VKHVFEEAEARPKTKDKLTTAGTSLTAKYFASSNIGLEIVTARTENLISARFMVSVLLMNGVEYLV